MKTFYFDRTGEPISVDEYCRLTGDKEYRRVAFDRLPDGREVSTVWLGLDHGWGGTEPIIFETMIFGGSADFEGENQWRYRTEDEAKLGHATIVSALLKGETPQ